MLAISTKLHNMLRAGLSHRKPQSGLATKLGSLGPVHSWLTAIPGFKQASVRNTQAATFFFGITVGITFGTTFAIECCHCYRAILLPTWELSIPSHLEGHYTRVLPFHFAECREDCTCCDLLCHFTSISGLDGNGVRGAAQL